MSRMQLGQTSVIYFISNLLASAIGFAASLYIARNIGAEPLGIYNVGIGVAAWLGIVGRIGISGAISKRVSEGNEQGEYAVAGTLMIGSLFVILATGVLLFRPYVNQYVEYSAAVFVVLILFASLAYSVVSSLLTGLHLVHLTGVLSTVRTAGRGLVQIVAVIAGFGAAGLFWGHLAGLLLIVVIGLYAVWKRLPSIKSPKKRHFRSLVDFAKFSWLGNLQSRMFNYTDILVLGFFVSSSLIGIYSIAWNVAQFLIIFSGALSSTLFPEMSKLSAQQDQQAAADTVEQSLAYGGLFLIPGVFGGGILGERILQVYGPEFTQGATVLFVLIIANLFMGYQNQLLNALNAIDRPDLSFRVNAAFVTANIVFNIILIYLYGWIGAAVATAGSTAISLVLSYYYLSRLITFELPKTEILRQGFAAAVMASIVYGGLLFENSYRLVRHNVITVLLLVGIGAAVYFMILLGLSPRFRETVDRNIPFAIPLISS